MTDSPRRSATHSRTTARWVLAASTLATSMSFIDVTALSVALPGLQAGMQASGEDLLWVTNAYALPLATLLLLGGKLGDHFGHKRVFIIGILIFAAGSLASGLATSLGMLLTARVIQGVGGAIMIPGSLAMLLTHFDAAHRGRAIGTWSAFTVLATAVGPILGGLLAREGLWRGVFFLNLPFAAVAITILLAKVPAKTEILERLRIDYAGTFWLVLGMCGINYGLIAAPRQGFDSPEVIVSLLVGGTALAQLALRHGKTGGHSYRRDFFTSRTLTVASLITLFFYTALNGLLFFLPLNLIQVQGYDPVLAGLAQLPLMVLVVLLSRWAGGLMDRRGPRIPLTVGPALAGLGFMLLLLPDITQGPGDFWAAFAPGLLLVGMGLGITAAPLSATVMASMPADQLGFAAGINSMLAKLSAVMGIAILGPIAIFAFGHALEMQLEPLQLSLQARAQLRLESLRLAEAIVPAGLSAETAAAVLQAIKLAFVGAFQTIIGLCAALSWLSSVLAAFLLKDQWRADPSTKI